MNGVLSSGKDRKPTSWFMNIMINFLIHAYKIMDHTLYNMLIKCITTNTIIEIYWFVVDECGLKLSIFKINLTGGMRDLIKLEILDQTIRNHNYQMWPEK